MSIYQFIQGLDYGPRRTTAHPNASPRGLEFHMTEGNGGWGDVLYLARRAGETIAEWRSRVSGVSAHVVIVDDGRVVQMVDFDHVNGNLNPADRAGETTYYGHHHLVDVLGDPQWKDPNVYSLSAEIAGKRADGPTTAQVRSAIAWSLDMKARYASLRGAYGHHDQSTKACPGLTANMKAIFAGVGGHGLWAPTPEEINVHTEITILPWGGTYTIPAGATPTGIKIGSTGEVTDSVEWAARTTSSSAHYDANVVTTATRGNPFIRVIDGTFKGFLVSIAEIVATPNPAPDADCSPAIIAAVKKALDHVQPIANSLQTAISEARSV